MTGRSASINANEMKDQKKKVIFQARYMIVNDYRVGGTKNNNLKFVEKPS